MDTERAGNDYPDNRAVLGSEYCSGYIDTNGKWHTGFYCPHSDDTLDIFCCGTTEDKYCCTQQDLVVQEEVEGWALLLACMLGMLTACLMVTMAGCLMCPTLTRRTGSSKAKNATWNRLTHADSGSACQYSDTSLGSAMAVESLPSVYHCSGVSTSGHYPECPGSTPGHVSVTARDSLHSPTLPHSLSDHIGLVSEDVDICIKTLSEDGSLALFAQAGTDADLQFRNLHYTLPRGAYIVIPQHSTLIRGRETNPDCYKSCPDVDCIEQLHQSQSPDLFSTKF